MLHEREQCAIEFRIFVCSHCTRHVVSYADMQASLPTKLDLEEVFGDSYQDSNSMAESQTNKDTTVKQLTKDMSRDRVVIQGG